MLSNTVDVIYYFSLIKDEIKLKDIMNMVIKMNTLVYRNASILQALFLFSYFEVHYIIFPNLCFIYKDHKKLPFMAMLRNLRNLIKAGISPKHHQSILRRLQDEVSL